MNSHSYEQLTLPLFLGELNANGIAIREDNNDLSIKGTPSKSQRQAIRARTPEILAHYRASPGSKIVRYPVELKNQSLAFQEMHSGRRAPDIYAVRMPHRWRISSEPLKE